MHTFSFVRVSKTILLLCIFTFVSFLFLTQSAQAVEWDVSSGTLSDDSFDFGAQTSGPRSMAFANSGTKMYIGDWDGNVYQYTLSTAYDLTTASYDSSSYDLPEIGTSGLEEIVMSDDGIKLLALEFYDRRIYEYDLGTPYDITTATYSTNSFYISQGQNNYGFSVKPDGTKVYVMSDYDDKVFQYTLSTPWDVSTMTYDTVFMTIPNLGDGQVLGIYVGENGENLYLETATNERIHWFTLSTAWDVSTGSYESSYYQFVATDSWATSMTMKPDGSSMFVLGYSNETIFELVLATPATSSRTVEVPKVTIQAEYNQTCDGQSFADISVIGMNSSWEYRATDQSSEETYTSWAPLESLFTLPLTGTGERTIYVQVRTQTGGVRVFTDTVNAEDSMSCETSDSSTETALTEDALLDPIIEVESESYIRGVTLDTIYYVNENMERRPFMNHEIFLTYEDDFENILSVSLKRLEDMPLGVPMAPNHETSIVTFDYNPTTYKITADGALQELGSDTEIEKKYGNSWKTMLFRLHEIFFVRMLNSR